MTHKIHHIALLVVFIMPIAGCFFELGQTVILKPDEYRYVYEVKETVALRAIAGVIKEKNMGANVVIDYHNRHVDSDYVHSDLWRTKTQARVRKLNWKECEVVLAVTTEKSNGEDWEMRRLLQKEQYNNLFDVIDLKIYEEMSKIN